MSEWAKSEVGGRGRGGERRMGEEEGRIGGGAGGKTGRSSEVAAGP